MNDLPVLRLTQLLTSEEIKTVHGVHKTHNVGFCPLGVCIPDESCGLHRCSDSESGDFCEERYTPLSYYAVSVWRETVTRLEAMPEFADALQVEWYPVAATFRSIRYINDKRLQYIQTFRKIAAEIADTQNIKIHYGRFDSPASAEYPDYPLRTYVMTEELFKAKRGWGIKNEVADLPKDEMFSYSWAEIKDYFVELSPQQLAFNAGDLMNNRGSELDQQFLAACGELDLPLMKELFAQGANIHAVDDSGDMAVQSIMLSLLDIFFDTEGLSPEENEKLTTKYYQQALPLLQWLINQGYDLNISAYEESTPLYDSVYAPDAKMMKFLLENGADPNVDCYITNDGGDMTNALDHVFMEHYVRSKSDFPMLDEMEELLKKYGAE